jgi:uncharacterized membrane protein YtjA (UPF0391 family)
MPVRHKLLEDLCRWTARREKHPALPENHEAEGTASALPERFVTIRKEGVMVYWAAVFLVIALVAALLGFTGIAGMSMNIAWILFVVGMIFAVALFIMGRSRRA